MSLAPVRPADAAGVPGPIPLRYFSAFSGIGGFELAIRQAAPSWRCVGCSEIDPPSLSVYERHFPHHRNYGDITRIEPNNVPDFDLLTGGFPCQPFSQAGRRRGLSDPRGGPVLAALFGLIQAKQPALLLLENVKGLLSQDGGSTFRAILRRLHVLGYRTEWQILDSQLHGGVPQRRERVYLLGHRRHDHDGSSGAGSGGKVFPLAGVRTQDESITSGAPSSSGPGNAAVSLHARKTGRSESGTPGPDDAASKRLGLSQRHFFTLTTRPDAALLIGCGDLSRFPEGDLLSEALGRDALESLPLRRLTPLEWERLQGFPDGWTGGAGLSDARRYRCLGNAVTVGVVRAVVTALDRSRPGGEAPGRTAESSP